MRWQQPWLVNLQMERKGEESLRRERERESPQPHKDINKPRNSDMADPLVLKKIILIFMQIRYENVENSTLSSVPKSDHFRVSPSTQKHSFSLLRQINFPPVLGFHDTLHFCGPATRNAVQKQSS